MVVMGMDHSEIGVSRISKLLIDRDQLDAGDVLSRRRGFTVTLLCRADCGEHSSSMLSRSGASSAVADIGRVALAALAMA
jgi:hypothetical protein